MDQAATQPARNASAAPANAVTAAIQSKVDLAALPPPTSTCVHAGAPTPGFWEKTMDPTVFWSAASATATALAIVAAFLVPWLSERRQQRIRSSYAVQMLPPVFDEAAQLGLEAERIYALCIELMGNIKVTDLGEHQASGLVEKRALQFWDPAARKVREQAEYFPSELAITAIRQFSETAMPAYDENRSWLAGLRPSTAGMIQNYFSEAAKCLRTCRQVVAGWPDERTKISPDHIRELLGPVLRTREAMQLAARLLSRLVGKLLPEELDLDFDRP